MKGSPSEKKIELNRALAGIYLETDKPLVVKYIKDYIKHNGYINTKYASKMAVDGKIFQNDEHRDAFFESVSAMLVNTGKYTRELNKDPGKGYNILLNSAYFNNRSVRIIALLSLAISLLSFGYSIVSGSKPDHRQDLINIERQRLELDRQTQNSVIQSLRMIDQKIIEKDSDSHR
jgi:hypothetical protein